MTQPLQTQRFTLHYTYGGGRCGSTLLDYLLNGYSQMMGLGQISRTVTIFDPLDCRRNRACPRRR